MAKAQRFLIVNVFGIGDVLFTTPLIRNIRQHCADATIAYVCNRRALPVLEHHPDIQRVFVYDRDSYRQIAQRSRWQACQKAWHALRVIRNERFDVVLDLSMNVWSHIFMWAAGIPRRVGLNYRNRGRLLTDKIPFSGFSGRHVVEHYLDVLAPLHIPVRSRRLEIFCAPEDRQWARALWQQESFDQTSCVVTLAPGGGASWGKQAASKRLPPEYFVRLAQYLRSHHHAHIVFVGDRSESGIVRQILDRIDFPVVNLQGKTSLGQLAAVLAMSDCVVANDGGILHMAVAAGTGTISFFGPVDEEVYGPNPPQGHAVVTAKAVCRPCYRRFRRARCEHLQCLTEVGIEDFYAAADCILADAAAGKAKKISRIRENSDDTVRISGERITP